MSNTRKSDLRSMLQLAWPVVFAELGWMLQGVIDVIMVGRLGPIAIGAVALGNVLFYAPSLFGLGLLLGLDTVVAQAFGRDDLPACRQWLAQGTWIAVASTAPLMPVAYGISRGFPLFHVSPELVAPTSAYLVVLLWSTLPLLLYTAARRYLQAVGHVRIITVVFVFTNLLNWAGNYLLISGRFGLPALGIRGSALSTVVSRVFMALSLFAAIVFYERKAGRHLFRRWPMPRRAQIMELLRLGLPTAGQFLLEVGAFGITAVLAGKLSSTSLAAHEIVLNYAALAFMVPLGLSTAAAVAVGQAIGAREPRRAWRAAVVALTLGVAFMGLVAAAYLVLHHPLIALYTHDAGVARVAAPLFRAAAVFAIFDGVQIVVTGALRGAGDTRTAMWAHMIGYYVIGLPLGALLCFRYGMGVLGLWVGITTALVFIGVVLFVTWRKQFGALTNRLTAEPTPALS